MDRSIDKSIDRSIDSRSLGLGDGACVSCIFIGEASTFDTTKQHDDKEEEQEEQESGR